MTTQRKASAAATVEARKQKQTRIDYRSRLEIYDFYRFLQFFGALVYALERGEGPRLSSLPPIAPGIARDALEALREVLR